MSGDSVRFSFRFTGANRAMRLLGLNPGTCAIELTDQLVDVRFGWSFRCQIPIDSIDSVSNDHQPVRSWGAHGWRHRWLVNATSKDLIRLDLNEMARGRVLVFPLRIRVLRVGIEDSDQFRESVRSRMEGR